MSRHWQIMQCFAIADFNNWFIIHKIIEVLEQSAWITSSTFFNLVFNLQIHKCKSRHHSINNFNKTACSYNNTVHVFLNKKQLLKENWTLKSSLSYLIKLSFNFWFPCFVLEIFQFLWYANYTYDVVYEQWHIGDVIYLCYYKTKSLQNVHVWCRGRNTRTWLLRSDFVL